MKIFSGKSLHLPDVNSNLSTCKVSSRRNGGDSKQIRDALSNDFNDTSSVLRTKQPATSGTTEKQLRSNHNIDCAFINHDFFRPLARHHELVTQGTRWRLHQESSSVFVCRRLPQSLAHILVASSFFKILRRHQKGICSRGKFSFFLENS